MRFNSQGGKGNVNENVFAAVVEVLMYICDNSLHALPKLSPVIAGSVELRLVDAIRELLGNWLCICSSDGSLQGSFVADK